MGAIPRARSSAFRSTNEGEHCESPQAMPISANDVLVSSTLRDLVIGSGLEFEDRGGHELKGVPGEWHLFAVAS
jgi:hypothetical protein